PTLRLQRTFCVALTSARRSTRSAPCCDMPCGTAAALRQPCTALPETFATHSECSHHHRYSRPAVPTIRWTEMPVGPALPSATRSEAVLPRPCSLPVSSGLACRTCARTGALREVVL